MARKSYGIYCPTSKACEVLEPRWTIQILCELWDGATRFNAIRRALPALSPSLLSRRLKEMECEGLVRRVEDKGAGTVDYFRTEKAVELEPILDGMARWAQRHVEQDIALSSRDAGMLMWKLRPRFRPEGMPAGRNVLRFHFTDSTGHADTYWIVAERGSETDLCHHDPRIDPDLFVESTVGALTGVYLGRLRLSEEIDKGTIFLSGDARLVHGIRDWLSFSPYATVPGLVSAGDIHQAE